MHAAAPHTWVHVCVFAEEVCVEEMEACTADKECSMLHKKLQHLQAAMKKGSGHGGKGGDDDADHKKPPNKEYGQNGWGKGSYGKQRRQLDGHVKSSEDGKEKKESIENKTKGLMEKKDMGDKGGEEKEPSAEFKAAAKACTENELCKNLMECKTKHKESGGKGDHGL